MFAPRYFADRYYPPRYWPYAGDGAESPAPATTVSGGWLSPEQVKRLRSLARKAEASRERDWDRELEEQADRVSELRTVFDRVQGTVIDTPEKEVVAEAVRPFEKGFLKPRSRVPRRVDFNRLLASANAVALLADALAALEQRRIEEDDMEVLTLFGMFNG